MSSGRSVELQVRLQVGLLHRRPDPCRERRQLRRIEHLEARVLVEQRLERRQLVVAVGAHHRRHQVVDDQRVDAALGLHPLAGIVDDERIDQRHVGERGVGRACRTTAPASCPAATRACRACRGGRSRRRPRRRPATGSRRGSGGSAAARGRGRSTRIPPPLHIPAAAGSRRARCRARARRSRSASSSTYWSPGGGPHLASIEPRSCVGSVAYHRR